MKNAELSITAAFEGKRVLFTGSTGFVGKVALSMLLHRFPRIGKVYPLVRPTLGSTAATYLLGVKQSLAGLRGRWHSCRGAKLAVTYHPAFLLRDPRMKGEAWKDLQMVMKEMGLKAPAKS